jgi:hypothetical protein
VLDARREGSITADIAEEHDANGNLLGSLEPRRDCVAAMIDMSKSFLGKLRESPTAVCP